MADQVKREDNKDQESGRPVQLDPEQLGGEQDEPQADTPQTEHGRQPTQAPAQSR